MAMAFADPEREEALVLAKLADFGDEYGAMAHDLAWRLCRRPLGEVQQDGRTVLPALRRLERKGRVRKLWYDSYHQGWRWSLVTPEATDHAKVLRFHDPASVL